MKVRRLGREIALGALYQMDLLRAPLESAIADAGHLMAKLRLEGEDAEPGPLRQPRDDTDKFLDQLREAREFARELCEAALARRDELDAIIERYAEGWTLSRMPSLDRNILRLALAEIVCFDDIPTSVSIDEAVDLAKEYSTAESGAFVNGILGSFARERGLATTER